MNLSVLLQRQPGWTGRGGCDRAKRWRSLVATWVHDYAPAIRGLVLASRPLRLNCMCRWHVLGWRYGTSAWSVFY